MKILIVGGGGREHALAWRLAQSAQVSEVIASPGNPGIEQIGRCVAAPESIAAYADLAEAEKVGLTVVGPEAPLVGGIVDAFHACNLSIVGPTKAAARLEGSKIFAKDFFRRAGIPTARSSDKLSDFSLPVVIKADGLAAGKGVVIARSASEAKEAIEKLGPQVLIEEFLEGEEVSFIGLSNGRQIVPFAPTQDHKRAYDGDDGPNTGGMGAYCDGRILTDAQVGDIMDRFMYPAIRQMEADGMPFTGFLYAGLMITESGPKILEFNVRLGDPETQVLMHSLESDLADVLLASTRTDIPMPELRFGLPSASVVAATAGYPEHSITGQTITGLEQAAKIAQVFHAGTSLRNGRLVTSGGRVLSVTASGETLGSAAERAYQAMEQVHFDGMHYRRDIGYKGLKRWQAAEYSPNSSAMGT